MTCVARKLGRWARQPPARGTLAQEFPERYHSLALLEVRRMPAARKSWEDPGRVDGGRRGLGEGETMKS